MSTPLIGSTLATIVVFVPLAFISGVTGGFFKALAVTMVAALIVSLLYSRFVIPLLAMALAIGGCTIGGRGGSGDVTATSSAQADPVRPVWR